MIESMASAMESAPGPSHLALRSIDVTVSDLDAALAYYRTVIPLEEMRRFALPVSAFGAELVSCRSGSAEILVARSPTLIVNFMRFAEGRRQAEPQPVTGPGYTHICIQSPSTDPALPKLMRKGLSMVSRCDEQGVDIGGYGVRYAYGRDPEGRMLEVEMLDRPARPESGWITHIANVVHDHAGMMDFYGKLLRRPPYRTIEQSGRPTLDAVAGIDNIGILGGWFRIHNAEIEVWTYTRPLTPPPSGRRQLDEIGYNAFSIEVADIATETQRLERLGIVLVGTEIDFGGWRTRYAVDPEGNLFSVQQANGAPLRESGTGFDTIGQ